HRGRIARDAELCILPQEERLVQFLNVTGRKKPTYCVWNCPRLDEMADVNSDQNDDQAEKDHDLILHYPGNIGSILLPMDLVLATSGLKGAVRIRVVGYETAGNIGYTSELTGLAAKYGATEIIEPLGTRARRSLLRLAAKAHVGLSLMPKRSENINM